MPPRRYGSYFLLLICSALSLGCSPFARAEPFDPASGRWTGVWYRQGEAVPAGPLQMTLTPSGEDTWLVLVRVEAQVETLYEFAAAGRREGSLVLFQGEVDLGPASGGIYRWSAEIDGNLLQGFFRHPSGDGRFELVRRPSASSPGAETAREASPAMEPNTSTPAPGPES